MLAQIHAVGRPAREGDRVVQLRERAARPDRRRPQLERAPPRRRPEEPRRRPGAHRRAAARALRERRRRRRGRDPARRRRTSTTCSAGSTWCSASATRTRRCSATSSSSARKSRQRRAQLKTRAGRAGQDRGRACEPEAVDREPARRAPADARRASRARSSSSRPRRRAGRRSCSARPRHGSRRSSAPPRRPRDRRQPSSPPTSFTVSIDSDATPTPLDPGRRPAVAVRRRRRDRDAVPRHAVRLGRLRARAASTAPGLVAYVYAQVGVSLPAQRRGAVRLRHRRSSYDDLQPGDLVFFSGLGHVGIYIGGGQFIHAPHTGDVVKISSLSDARRLRRRPPPLALAPSAGAVGAQDASYSCVDRRRRSAA